MFQEMAIIAGGCRLILPILRRGAMSSAMSRAMSRAIKCCD